MTKIRLSVKFETYKFFYNIMVVAQNIYGNLKMQCGGEGMILAFSYFLL